MNQTVPMQESMKYSNSSITKTFNKACERNARAFLNFKEALPMKNIYWNNQGKYQSDYNALKELVPKAGNAGTVEGEMMRAIGRVYYDYYQNGLKYNTSGAVNFLFTCDIKYNIGLADVLFDIKLECNTGTVTGQNLDKSMERMVDRVVCFVAAKMGKYTPSDVDMESYADNDFNELEFIDDFEEDFLPEYY